jgi:hypothetical protein
MKAVFTIISALIIFVAPALTRAETVTVSPATPGVSNCFPFGNSSRNGEEWGPFMGFIYRNVPPFSLAPGDILAFDLGAMNAVDVQLDIELAATTSNGGDSPDLPFTKVVSNTQIPLNPNGNDIVGDFEMQFTVEAPFTFPGGGLIIRFSNTAGPYDLYEDCAQVLVNTSAADPSGFFVVRYFGDPNGIPPYDFSDNESIGGFRVIASDTPPPPPVFVGVPTLSEWGMMAAAAGFGLLGAFYAVRRRKASV